MCIDNLKGNLFFNGWGFKWKVVWMLCEVEFKSDIFVWFMVKWFGVYIDIVVVNLLVKWFEVFLSKLIGGIVDGMFLIYIIIVEYLVLFLIMILSIR